MGNFFQKFQSRTAHKRKFQLFFEANSLILCQHLLGFFNHLKTSFKMLKEFFLLCIQKKSFAKIYACQNRYKMSVCQKKEIWLKLHKTTQTPETVNTHNKAYFVIKLA